jgi:hypothetical protein
VSVLGYRLTVFGWYVLGMATCIVGEASLLLFSDRPGEAAMGFLGGAVGGAVAIAVRRLA